MSTKFSYTKYTSRLKSILSQEWEDSLGRVVNILGEAQRIWICGNGGSMSTASHFAEDLMMAGLKAQAISDASFLTMAGNDFGYGEVFAKWLAIQADSKDVLVVISTSGRSINLCKACDAFPGISIGFIGRSGSPLSKVCDVPLELGTAEGMMEVRLAEDIHLSMCHMVSEVFRERRDAVTVYDSKGGLHVRFD